MIQTQVRARGLYSRPFQLCLLEIRMRLVFPRYNVVLAATPLAAHASGALPLKCASNNAREQEQQVVPRQRHSARQIRATSSEQQA